ncbi:putative mitochondrial protein AtMg00820 [Silene latifolia]|uniref:putative mitochondrial protein AtMg00820 n=1 Tax=Silene latifolia TaxID=37657 RepID=UPI003D76E894
MTTRAQRGIFKPTHRMNLSATTSLSPVPKNPIDALNDPNWKNAMKDEFDALIKNKTWILVPRPPDVNITRCIWLFKHKFKANGDLERYKARLVVNGRSQQVGVDCDETFSPVVKPTTIRTVLNLAVSKKWSIRQLDVKNAFLHGNLAETIMSHLSSEFAMSDLGPLNYFLGVAAVRHSKGLFLHQQKYAEDIVSRAKMQSCKPAQTPVDTKSKLSGSAGAPVSDPTLYRSLAGAL